LVLWICNVLVLDLFVFGYLDLYFLLIDILDLYLDLFKQKGPKIIIIIIIIFKNKTGPKPKLKSGF
jgi:hypothetical protein